MKFSIKLAMIWTVCLAPAAFAANTGGSLVGNGAGLAELEITYAYTVRLPSAITYCLNLPSECNLDVRDEHALRLISDILSAQPNPEHKLHYTPHCEDGHAQAFDYFHQSRCALSQR
jgi:hypothetical protein